MKVSNYDGVGVLHHNVYQAAFFSVDFNESISIGGEAMGSEHDGHLLLGAYFFRCS